MTIFEELKRLQRFKTRIEQAHKEHLRTGNYIPLGISAQDALIEYDTPLDK